MGRTEVTVKASEVEDGGKKRRADSTLDRRRNVFFEVRLARRMSKDNRRERLRIRLPKGARAYSVVLRVCGKGRQVTRAQKVSGGRYATGGVMHVEMKTEHLR